MSKVDEGLIRLCVDQFQVIATKVDTAVHNKRTIDERYHRALQRAVEQVAAQAKAVRGVEKGDLIRAVRGRLKAQIFLLETPSWETPEAHRQPTANKRVEIFREAVDLLTKELSVAE